jgi:hypothetical protein
MNKNVGLIRPGVGDIVVSGDRQFIVIVNPNGKQKIVVRGGDDNLVIASELIPYARHAFTPVKGVPRQLLDREYLRGTKLNSANDWAFETRVSLVPLAELELNPFVKTDQLLTRGNVGDLCLNEIRNIAQAQVTIKYTPSRAGPMKPGISQARRQAQRAGAVTSLGLAMSFEGAVAQGFFPDAGPASIVKDVFTLFAAQHGNGAATLNLVAKHVMAEGSDDLIKRAIGQSALPLDDDLVSVHGLINESSAIKPLARAGAQTLGQAFRAVRTGQKIPRLNEFYHEDFAQAPVGAVKREIVQAFEQVKAKLAALAAG